MASFVVHYTQRSRWETSSTLHRDGCGKVPFEGMPGKKRQGSPITTERAVQHAHRAAQPPAHFKVCACARKQL